MARLFSMIGLQNLKFGLLTSVWIFKSTTLCDMMNFDIDVGMRQFSSSNLHPQPIHSSWYFSIIHVTKFNIDIS